MKPQSLGRRSRSWNPAILLAVFVLFVDLRWSYADEVDDYVNRQMRRQHVAGLSLAVVKDGKLMKAKGYGLANVELKVQATPETVYNIASIGKQFTATAIMLLVEEGKMGLDDKITNHLSGLPPPWSPVTVRQLLTHTSGIKNYTSLPDFQKLARSPLTISELVQMLAAYPMEFRPGEKWSYCNTGYHLLAAIIEKVSQRPYMDFLKERIFAPSGMDSTRGYNWQSIITNRASPYSWEDEALRNAEYLDYSWAFGAGAVASTVLDMVKWDAALSANKLLPKKRWDEMWTAVKLNDGSSFPYGFGWHVQTEPDDPGRVIWHGGGDPGFLSADFHWIDDRTTVIVFLTAGSSWLPNGQDSSGDIGLGVSRRYIPRLVSKPIEDTAPQITAKMKTVLETLISGTLDANLISPKWSGKKVSGIKQWASQLSDLGKMKSFLPIWKDVRLGRYDYRARYAKEALHFGATLDENGKVSSIDLEIE
jgi:CubicO group peptidase (beta-lactamase class C family)